MFSETDVVLEDNPTASERLLTLLKSHLPYSLAVLRRVQCAQKFPGASTPDTHVLYAHQRSETQHGVEGGHFAAAYVDLSRAPETEVWIYSTLENVTTSTASAYGIPVPSSVAADGEEGDDVTRSLTASATGYTPAEETTALDQVMTILRRIRAISVALGRGTPPTAAAVNSGTSSLEQHQQQQRETNDDKIILVGALHETLRRGLLARGVAMEKAPFLPPDIAWEFCHKWLFRVEDLPVGLGLRDGMRWDRLREGDVDVVLGRTNIKRRG